jgi:hypothetical protein
MPTSHLRNAARFSALAVALLVAAGAATAPALARGGPGPGGGGGGGDRVEVRVAGVCTKGASSRLKIKSRNGGIETEFEVHGRSGTWSVTLVHERNVAWRGKRRPSGPSRSFSVEYPLPDWSGADTVTARASGPRGASCTATAMLPG